MPIGLISYAAVIGETHSWRLRDLLALLDDPLVIHGDPQVEIRHVASHTSNIDGEGTLFVTTADSPELDRLVHEAARRGAWAVVASSEVSSIALSQVVTPRPGGCVGPLAQAVYGRPQTDLTTAAVTGTNGKTSTSRMMSRILQRSYGSSASLTTLGAEINGLQLPQPNGGPGTTPHIDRTLRFAMEVAAAGSKALVVEASSHGLEQGRLEGCRFDVSAFTGLGRDHIEYHGSREEYLAAKALLFTSSMSERCVVPMDVNGGPEVAARASCEVLTLSEQDSSHWARLSAVRAGHSETSFDLRCGGESVSVKLERLVGRYFARNAALAMACATALGVQLDTAAQALRTWGPVRGRMEAIEYAVREFGFRVFVDYGHTPDALGAVLSAARDFTSRDVHIVFGCGGGRDRSKRAEMGEVAAALANSVYVTSDNPRGEDPLAIIEEIVSGVEDDRNCTVEPDRRTAIELCLRSAREGDVVVVAGKGHEVSQETNGEEVPFDDAAVVREVLLAMKG